MICPTVECTHEIADSDVRVLLTEDAYLKYHTFTLSLAVDNQKDISWCPTPDCKFAFVLQADQEDEQKQLLDCPLCTKKYCLRCKVLFHEDMSCKEYQARHGKDSEED